MAVVEVVGADAAGDAELVGGLVGGLAGLVNRVYAVAEEGLWVEGRERTSAAEIAELVAAGEIAVARPGDQARGIVGSGCTTSTTTSASSGCSSPVPPTRGTGVGRDLVAFAEDRCRRQGRAVMQLELLVPRGWVHPAKVSLDAWYTRLGYRPVHTAAMDAVYPRVGPLLATPCDLVTYQKPLGPRGR